MFDRGTTAPGRFCWVDLAATDAARAKDFYGRLFGWAASEQPANAGNLYAPAAYPIAMSARCIS